MQYAKFSQNNYESGPGGQSDKLLKSLVKMCSAGNNNIQLG